MIYKIYAPFALALISTVASAKTAEECLHKDERFLNAHESYGILSGIWFDDGEVLLAGEWETGMHVKRINYCLTEEDDKFISMQVVVGNDTKELSLRKHGGEGGACRAFKLDENDYILDI